MVVGVDEDARRRTLKYANYEDLKIGRNLCTYGTI